MPRAKHTPARSRSGPDIPEAQRHTSRIFLRLPPDVAGQLRTRAESEGLTLSAYVARLIATDLAIV